MVYTGATGIRYPGEPMNTINSLITKAGVIAKAAVTYLVALTVLLQFILVQDVVAEIPNAAQYITQAIAFIGGVVAIIRRVTPVPAEERGLTA